MKIGFIGAGRVGFTLGKYFCEHGVEVAGYYSRNIQSAQEAAEFTHSRVYDVPAKLLEACDILFLTMSIDVFLSIKFFIKLSKSVL